MSTAGRDSIVIVGASLAGLRAASVLRGEGYGGDLTIIGGESETYDRPPLSKGFLSGEVDLRGIQLRGREVDARWKLGAPATCLDLDSQLVETSDGERVPYDAIIIATGSRARELPGFPVDRERVFALRTLEDAVALKSALQTGPHVVIIGAGFIGVEVASTCRALGLPVDIVAVGPPLEHMGPMVSAFASDLCITNGVTVHQDRQATGMVKRAHGVDVELDDGTTLNADIIVVAVGAVPDVAWLRSTDLNVEQGVPCDELGYVDGRSDVLAAGDVCTWPGPDGTPTRVEHWSNAIEQGTIVARQLLNGRGGPPPLRVPSAWSDHFGVRMQSIGYPALADETRIITGSVTEGRFAAEMYRDGELIAAVGYGLPAVIASYRGRLARQHSAV